MPKKSFEGSYNYIYLITALICVIIAAIIASFIIIGDIDKAGESDESSPEISVPTPDESEESVPVEESVIPQEEFTAVTVDNEEVNKGTLILINSDEDCVFPAKEQLDLLNMYNKKKDGTYPLPDVQLSGTGHRLNSLAFKAFNDMVKVFSNSTTEKTGLIVNNAYTEKSEFKAQTLYSQADLGSGYSVRINVYQVAGKLGSGPYKWLEEHAHEFGYVLRYPEGKEGETGVEASSMIYRYVGIPHAYYMYRNGLSLDEYLNAIRGHSNTNPAYITVDGVEHRLYFQTAEQGGTTIVNIPEGFAHTISGNNSSGFIICAYPEQNQ